MEIIGDNTCITSIRPKNKDEVGRNRGFLALQDMLPVTLNRTRAEETGKNALIRFAEVTDEDVEFSQ